MPKVRISTRFLVRTKNRAEITPIQIPYWHHRSSIAHSRLHAISLRKNLHTRSRRVSARLLIFRESPLALLCDDDHDWLWRFLPKDPHGPHRCSGCSHIWHDCLITFRCFPLVAPRIQSEGAKVSCTVQNSRSKCKVSDPRRRDCTKGIENEQNFKKEGGT